MVDGSGTGDGAERRGWFANPDQLSRARREREAEAVAKARSEAEAVAAAADAERARQLHWQQSRDITVDALSTVLEEFREKAAAGIPAQCWSEQLPEVGSNELRDFAANRLSIAVPHWRELPRRPSDHGNYTDRAERRWSEECKRVRAHDKAQWQTFWEVLQERCLSAFVIEWGEYSLMLSRSNFYWLRHHVWIPPHVGGWDDHSHDGYWSTRGVPLSTTAAAAAVFDRLTSWSPADDPQVQAEGLARLLAPRLSS